MYIFRYFFMVFHAPHHRVVLYRYLDSFNGLMSDVFVSEHSNLHIHETWYLCDPVSDMTL